MAEVAAWQNRPLEPMYPVVFFDALRLKIRDEGAVRNKAVYLALGMLRRRPPGRAGAVDRADRRGQVLAQGVQRAEEPRRRRHPDRRGRRPEGLPRSDRGGLPAGAGADLHRASDPQLPGLRGWKDRKAVAAELRTDLPAASAEAAPKRRSRPSRRALGHQVSADRRRPGAGQWAQVIPFFAFPPEVRRIIYTTNAIESLHMQLRKIVKTRGHFPSDEAATKLLCLALRNVLANQSDRPATGKVP